MAGLMVPVALVGGMLWVLTVHLVWGAKPSPVTRERVDAWLGEHEPGARVGAWVPDREQAQAMFWLEDGRAGLVRAVGAHLAIDVLEPGVLARVERAGEDAMRLVFVDVGARPRVFRWAPQSEDEVKVWLERWELL